MENNETKKEEGRNVPCGHCAMRGGTHCGWGCPHRFVALRIIIGVVILIAVFAIGVKVGEFKERIIGAHDRGYYGAEGMRRGYMMDRGLYGNAQMIRVENEVPTSTQQQ